MKFLVTGGAGYIGSHMVKFLLSKNHEVTVFDNLSTGKLINKNKINFIKVNLLNRKKLDQLMSKKKFDAVFHFAALSIVNESEKKPRKYYMNNVLGTKNLINSMIKYKLNNLIFSSSASVYGAPKTKKILETHQMKPISEYGKNKKEIEKILAQIGKKKNFKSISFRYFNAAGADESAKIGENHKPETHLIPKILNSIKRKQKKVYIYGNSYKTIDGTCVRDYIHVNDIVRAHYYGLKKFRQKKCILNYNIGSGKGYSVLEIINGIEKVTRVKLKIIYKKKRKGDPPILVADCKKIFKDLRWKPKYKNIDKILLTAWQWHKKPFI
jgi:UDP-glucose 4-epimerase